MLFTVAAVALASAFQGCSLSVQEREEINLYLTCDDCAPEVSSEVVDLGWRAMPRIEGALIGPHSSRVEIVGQNAGQAHSLIPSSAIDSSQFAEAAVSAYTDAYQARAAIALGEIAERNTAPGCFFRQLWPPVTCWEQARDALKDAEARASADSTWYSPAVQDVIDEQLQTIEDQGHWWTGYKIIGTAIGVVVVGTVTAVAILGAS